MSKLNETQLTVFSTAAQHDDGSAGLPDHHSDSATIAGPDKAKKAEAAKATERLP
jgi:hypothetical protein